MRKLTDVLLHGFVLRIVLSTMVVAAFVSPSQADVIYTTFGTGICGGDPTCVANNGINQNYDAVDGWTNTISPGETEMIADAFTPGANYTLSDVKLVLQDLGDGNANIYITADSGFDTPGAVLENWLNQAPEAFASPQLNALTLSSVLTPALTAGTRYWLVVAPTGSNDATGYNFSWNVDISGSSQLFDGTPNAPNGFADLATAPGNWHSDGPGLEAAFQIDGTPVSPGPPPAVPEPATWMLLGTGLVGLWGCRRFSLR